MARFNNHITPTDNDLINHYLHTSDTEVLGQVYERYMHLVYGVCLKYLKDREWAKDGVIRIFEKLVEEIPKQSIDNFKPWIYTVTKNFCLMEIRSRNASKEREKKWADENMEFVDNSYQMHPIDGEINDELNKALRNCIDKLKQEQKKCIELFYFNEKCYQEISDELNIQLNKVKSYIQNGKRNLRICLEKHHEIGQEAK